MLVVLNCEQILRTTIYFTLTGEDGSVVFADTLKVLDDYFIPKANIPFERHLFRQIVQDSSETVDQFVCRLRQRALSCDFGANEDDYIRDQLIDKCYSSHMRRKFLEKEGTVKLDDLLKISRTQEAVNRQMKVMVNANASASQVNAVSGKTSGNTHSGKVKKCFDCGLEGHFKGDYKCPARGKACRECGDYDHFRNQCSWFRRHGGGRGAAGGGRGAVGGGRGAAGGGRRATGGGRFQRRPGRTREANHVAGVDDSDQRPNRCNVVLNMRLLWSPLRNKIVAW